MATAKKPAKKAPAKKPAAKKAPAKKPASVKPATKTAASKAPAKKPAAKKPATKSASSPATKSASKAPKADKPATKRTPNAAFMAALNPSPELAAVIGDKPLPRTEITKKLWEYIKKYNLQDSANKRMINGDEKLKAIFGKPQVSMFEMTKLVSKHITN
jgi:chromatin remodeling complex protein RSC6